MSAPGHVWFKRKVVQVKATGASFSTGKATGRFPDIASVTSLVDCAVGDVYRTAFLALLAMTGSAREEA